MLCRPPESTKTILISGDYGKLGHGNTVTQKVPKQVLGSLSGKVVVFISAGYRHSAAVTDDGSLYTWGEGGAMVGEAKV